MSGPRFLVPSDVSDSIAERENCILFTQRLQYATFPLYSLQLTTHSTCTDTQAYKDTHMRALRWMQTHTNLAQGLKPFLPLAWVFQQRCDILPWHVIKKCHRFWGSDFHCSLPPNGQKGRRQGRVGMMNWCWTKRANSTPQGRITFSCGMMEAAYSLSALPLSRPLRGHQAC